MVAAIMSWAPDRSHTVVAAEVPEAFGAQFSWGDGDYLYRRNGVGPAIPVTGDELEAFCLRYIRWSRWMAWVVVLVPVVVVGGVFAWIEPQTAYSGWLFGVVVLALVIGFYNLYGWARTAPDRALAGRSPVAPALTRDEAQIRELSSTPLWYFIVPIFVPLIWMPTIIGNDTNAPLLKLAAAVVGVAVMVVSIRRAIQKWRFDKTGRLT